MGKTLSEVYAESGISLNQQYGGTAPPKTTNRELRQRGLERRQEVAGRANGDGIGGMSRLYAYEAAIHVLEGVQQWILNYAAEAHRRHEMAVEAAQQRGYRDLADCLEWIAHHPPRSWSCSNACGSSSPVSIVMPPWEWSGGAVRKHLQR